MMLSFHHSMMWDSARGLFAATVWVLLVWQSSCHYPILEGGMTASNTSRLRCTKTGGWGITGLFTVYWYRNDTLVFETYRRFGSYVHIVDNRFEKSVHLNIAWRSHTVTVSDVHEGMSIWRCNNDNNKNTWSEPIEISSNTAGVKPFTPITQTPFEGNVTLNVHPDKIVDDGNVTVSCTVETGGHFNISNMAWLQNSEEIFVTFSNGSHLVLDNSITPAVMDVTQSNNQHNVTMIASPYVNGTEWTCGIPVLATISNTVLIQVLEPTGNVSLDVYPEEVEKGTGYSLSCTVKTEDPVRASHMTWRQNCEEYIVTFGNGSYDIVGNSTSSVIARPHLPSNLKAVNICSRSVTLTWEKGSNGGAKQRFNIQYRKPGGQWTTHPTLPTEDDTLQLVIDGLEPGTVYEIRINTQNEYGTSNYTSAIVTTDTANPSGVPVYVVIIACVTSVLLTAALYKAVVVGLAKRKSSNQPATTKKTESNYETTTRDMNVGGNAYCSLAPVEAVYVNTNTNNQPRPTSSASAASRE
ncbi:uncharacterized protein LOC124292421 [Haliotis rubra]|uniref:uncharacterized protein LOC124292421 n=1 Tax=Haliotis rubra TaxID=36100 RepID=UPI001EE5FAFE|nr:uncharacterized protein LOC124292421 [Haliotis rubra]